MAVVQDRDRGLILRVVERALRLMLLHHRDGLRSERGTQPLQFAYQMGHVPTGVLKNHGLETVREGDAVLDRKPATPGLTEQVDPAKPERLAHRLDLLGVAFDGPQRRIGWPVRLAATQLVVGDDAIPVIGDTGVRLAEVIARQPGPAVQAQHHLFSGAEAVGGHPVTAGDRDGPGFVRLAPLNHEALCPYRVRFESASGYGSGQSGGPRRAPPVAPKRGRF